MIRDKEGTEITAPYAASIVFLEIGKQWRDKEVDDFTDYLVLDDMDDTDAELLLEYLETTDQDAHQFLEVDYDGNNDD